MHKLVFATTNSRKIKEAKAACEPAGIFIIPQKLDIEEIQNPDGKKVAMHKAKQAFNILQKPVVVTDTFWNISALNGFPGPYMKDVDIWFSVLDWQNLLRNKNKEAICYENVVFADKTGKLHYFVSTFKGEFVNEPSGSLNNLNLERMFSFDGGKNTLADLHDNNKLAYHPDDYCWADFVKWYKNKYL